MCENRETSEIDRLRAGENRLFAHTNDAGSQYVNTVLIEGEGREQNTWSVGRTGLNGTYRTRTYDHAARHVLLEGDPAWPEIAYVLGPVRDELLAVHAKTGQWLHNDVCVRQFSPRRASAGGAADERARATELLTDGRSDRAGAGGRNDAGHAPGPTATTAA